MKVQEIVERNFLNQLKRLYTSLNGKSTPLWNHFLDKGLPLGDEEVFRYVKLRHLYEQTMELSNFHLQPSIDCLIYPECQESCLVFVNGCFRKDLSKLRHLPQSMVILPMEEAYKIYGGFLLKKEQQLIQEESNSFIHLNTLFSKDALFCYLPPKCQCEVPIQILHWIEGEECMLFPKISVIASKHSSVKFYRSQTGPSLRHWINECVDFTIEENASIEWVNNAFSSDDGWNFQHLRAYLKQDSRLNSLTVTNGAKTFRNDCKVVLDGNQAEANLQATWNLNEKREAHFNVLVEHKKQACTSMQKFKGVLDGFSRSSFEGKIYVYKEAQKTLAYQSNPHLILSEKAQSYSKPNLEIFADDVKASHGATVGQLDKEQVFYLQSRGMDAQLANKLLIQGFNREIIDQISLISAKNEALGLCN